MLSPTDSFYSPIVFISEQGGYAVAGNGIDCVWGCFDNNNSILHQIHNPSVNIEAMETFIKETIDNANDTDVLIKKFDIEIKKNDINDSTWINDNIVSFYLGLIKDRSTKHQFAYPTVHLKDVSFYNKISEIAI